MPQQVKIYTYYSMKKQYVEGVQKEKENSLLDERRLYNYIALSFPCKQTSKMGFCISHKIHNETPNRHTNYLREITIHYIPTIS